jgi:hypothetical protein
MPGTDLGLGTTMRKHQRIKRDLTMGTTPEIDATMEHFCNYFGQSPSAYVRQKLIEGMANDAIKIGQIVAATNFLGPKQ